jgi:hypothetical protein
LKEKLRLNRERWNPDYQFISCRDLKKVSVKVLPYSLQHITNWNVQGAVAIKKVGEEPTAVLEQHAGLIHEAREGAELRPVVQGTAHEHLAMTSHK